MKHQIIKYLNTHTKISFQLRWPRKTAPKEKKGKTFCFFFAQNSIEHFQHNKINLFYLTYASFNSRYDPNYIIVHEQLLSLPLSNSSSDPPVSLTLHKKVQFHHHSE